MIPDKRSILFVNGHLKVGGVEKALVDLLSWIDYDRYDVDLLLLEGDGDYLPLIPRAVRVLYKNTRLLDGPFSKSILSNLKEGRFGNVCYRIIQSAGSKFGIKLLRLLKFFLPLKRRYDVAIAFRPGHSGEIVAYAVAAARKFIWWHQGSLPENAGQRISLKNLFTEFDKVVTVSDGCKEMLAEAFELSDDRLSVVPNIIDSVKLSSLSDADDPYGDDKRFRIVSLSRFAPEKHLEDAVEAAFVLKDRLDFVWYIIGDGSEFSKVSRRVEELDLEKRVILPGSVANPYAFLKYADLMVHPSHVESLCLAVLEAMSLGIPCIAVRSTGPESFIESGINGFLVEKGGMAIADEVLNIHQLDDESLNRICEAGCETVRFFFSPEKVMKSFESLIDA